MNEIQIIKEGSELEKFLKELDEVIGVEEKKLVEKYGFRPSYNNKTKYQE